MTDHIFMNIFNFIYHGFSFWQPVIFTAIGYFISVFFRDYIDWASIKEKRKNKKAFNKIKADMKDLFFLLNKFLKNNKNNRTFSIVNSMNKGGLTFLSHNILLCGTDAYEDTHGHLNTLQNFGFIVEKAPNKLYVMSEFFSEYLLCNKLTN